MRDPFIYSSNYCFLRDSWELGTLLGTGNTEMNKMDKISALMGAVGGEGNRPLVGEDG